MNIVYHLLLLSSNLFQVSGLFYDTKPTKKKRVLLLVPEDFLEGWFVAEFLDDLCSFGFEAGFDLLSLCPRTLTVLIEVLGGELEFNSPEFEKEFALAERVDCVHA